MNILTLIFALSLDLIVVRSRTVSVSSQCDLDSEQTRIGRCVRPWLDLWEMIRIREPQAADLVFPIPLYSRESVLLLCGAYLNIKDACIESDTLKHCQNDAMIAFVKSHMSYFCGNYAPIALDSFNCIKRVISSEQNCLWPIQGVPLPTHQTGKCNGIPKFFDCVQSSIESHCGTTGVMVLFDAITAFGCNLYIDNNGSLEGERSKLNSSGQYTDEAAKQYIQSQLADVLPMMDAEQKSMNDKGSSDESTSMPKLLPKYFSIGKSSHGYRRKPISKLTSLDFIEANTFLESDPRVEIAFGEDPQHIREQPESSAQIATGQCDEQKQTILAKCYSPLIKRWNEIHSQSLPLSDVLFPLFNYSVNDVIGICNTLEITLEDCLSPQLLTDCQHNPLVEFVDQQLGVVCSNSKHDHLTTSYSCLRAVLSTNQVCLDLIPGRNVPGMKKDKKCVHMSQFYECMQMRVQKECGAESHSVFVEIINNYGCSLNLSQSLVSSQIITNSLIDAPTTNLSKNESEISRLNRMLPVQNTTRREDVLDGELFKYIISKECIQDIRNIVLECVKPLMISWKRIRENRPILQQFTLPTYRYTKAELLELCDGYANLYLCTGYASMQLCRNDELVRFARDHLGYVCNPMNLERFMQHFDCLRKVEEHNSDSCQYFIEGIAEPGKDQRKCRGVKQYNDCLQPKIRKECGKEAWNEFDKVIEWVGCRV